MPSKITPEQRIALFWSKVDTSGDCWIWTAARNRAGYGRWGWRGHALLAHRYAYEVTYGPITSGLFVCHHCDNPPCVRPEHLFLGDAKANSLDCTSKGRHRPLSGERSGQAKLKESDVRSIRSLVTKGYPYSWIAAEFGIGKSTVRDVAKRITWRSVA